jgi:hypothetical protein
MLAAPLFTEHLLYSRLCIKNLVHIVSFNSHNNPETGSFIIPVLQKRKWQHIWVVCYFYTMCIRFGICALTILPPSKMVLNLIDDDDLNLR